MSNNKPWYVIVERNLVTRNYTTKDQWDWKRLADYATGPFDTEDEAVEERDSESSQTFCFLTIDAKNEGYTADECYSTQEPSPDAIIFAPVKDS